jgi:hypothetical protein
MAEMNLIWNSIVIGAQGMGVATRGKVLVELFGRFGERRGNALEG